MANFNCKMCGGSIHYNVGDKIVTCEFCGSTQTISNITDERKINLFNRANALRLKNEFDKALATYETILLEFPNDAEAHWGLCLCKYGIEYVSDSKTGKKIPTCHRTLFEPIFDDLDYIEAIKNSDVISRDIYESEAKTIDSIQKKIIETSQKEDPYDIFICYKETDENNKRTRDSVLAQEIYNKLIDNGYRVFFSRITLERKLGAEYEPIIFAALRSSKVMLSIGTKAEYFNSPWVKNEWSRYLSFMKDDKDKYLIPCYADMDPYEMPEEFMMLQAQDMNKIGFIQDLIYGISKLISMQPKSGDAKTIKSDNSHIDNLVKRIELAIEDKDYAQASRLVEDVLNEDAECAIAYLYKIVISKSLTSLSDLSNLNEPLTNDKNYLKALRFADDELKSQIEEYNENIIKKIKYNENLGIYKKAIECKQSKQYKQAISYFNTIVDFKDSKEQIDECKDLINRIKENKYNQANQLLNDGKFDECIALFATIIDYKDSKDKKNLAIDLQSKENQYQKAKQYEGDDKISSYNKAISYLNNIIEYRDSKYLISKYKARIDEINRELEILKAKRKRRIKVSSIIACIIVGLLLFVCFLIIPASKYIKATKKIRNGDYEAAQEILNTISFSDSKEQISLSKAAAGLKTNDFEQAVKEIEEAKGKLIVSYNTLGGDQIQDQQCSSLSDYNSTFILTANKNGYEFSGWSTQECTVDTSHRIINVVLSANYSSLIEYHISYDLNSGSFNEETAPSTYDVETFVSIPNPTRRGYTFTGWEVNNNKIVEKDYVFPEGTYEDQNLKAIWKANSYTITYDPNGGVVDEHSVVINYDESFTTIKPTRDGYTFGGWYYGNQHVVGGVYNYEEDIVLSARWTTDAFLINYNLNGGINDSSNISQYTVEDEVIINNPTKKGYTFIGWTRPNQTIPNLEEKIEIGSMGDITLIANWTANTYSISFDVNCDNVSNVDNISATYDSNYILPTLERLGYIFSGWYNGTTKVESGKYENDHDISLIAKWEIINYSINYNLDGGVNNDLNDLTYTVEDNVSINAPSKEGYSFLGWTTANNNEYQNIVLINKGTIGNIQVTANWSANKYVCNLDVNTGNVIVNTNYEFVYDSTFSLPEPTKTGYLFGGWYDGDYKISGEIWKTAKDVTLIAHWTPRDDIQYIINYYKENIDDSDYTFVESKIKNGTADTKVNAETIEYFGYDTPNSQEVIIKADGSLVVDYYYQRTTYSISFISNGGEDIPTRSLKYGDSISSIECERNGYTFGGWYSDYILSDSVNSVTDSVANSLSLYAWWIEETKPKSFDFILKEDAYSILGFIGDESVVSIPSYIDGIPVTSIASLSSSTITSLTVPKEIQSIEKGALQCSSIQKVSLPFTGNERYNGSDPEDSYNSKKHLGYVFGDTYFEGSAVVSTYYGDKKYYVPISLKDVEIFDSEIILGYSLCNCNNIKSITISNKATNIGECAFGGCSSLEKLSVPFIGNRAIEKEDCCGYPLGSFFKIVDNGSTNVYQTYYPTSQTTSYSTHYQIPLSLKEVIITGDGNLVNSAFIDCTMITNITITGDIKIFGMYAFCGCENLIDFVFPDNIEVIGAHCFERCSSLEKIEIPDSVTIIPEKMFYQCSSLNELIIYGDVTFVGKSAFAICSIEKAIIPTTVVSVNSGLSSQLREVEFINGTGIWDEAFKNCSLTKVICCDSIITIGNSTFKGCGSLEEIVLPKNLQRIDNYAFGGCANLKSIELPNSVNYIGSSVFSGCTSLDSVELPLISNEDANSVFSDCTSLKSIILPDGLTYIGDYWFFRCSSLETIILPDTIASIGEHAFCDCSSLNNIILPDSITQINNSTFASCTSLANITLPKNLTAIYSSAFSGCAFEEITIPSGVLSVSSSAFKYCTNLKHIIFQSGFKSIGDNAFAYCISLESITIPKTMTSVSSYAFDQINNLSDVYYEGSVSDKNSIQINALGNSSFKNASWHYNCELE